jgi:hypothetical protein
MIGEDSQVFVAAFYTLLRQYKNINFISNGSE